jgi:hypothetical protein
MISRLMNVELLVFHIVAAARCIQKTLIAVFLKFVNSGFAILTGTLEASSIGP